MPSLRLTIRAAAVAAVGDQPRLSQHIQMIRQRSGGVPGFGLQRADSEAIRPGLHQSAIQIEPIGMAQGFQRVYRI